MFISIILALGLSVSLCNAVAQVGDGVKGSSATGGGSNPPFPTSSASAASGAAPSGYVAPCRAAYGNQTGCSYCRNDLAMKPVEQSSVKITPFSDVNFASNQGMSGYTVWFSIPTPDDGCKTLIVVPTHDAEPAYGTQGVTVVAAEQSGCYGASIGSNGYGIAKCCGSDDCKTAGAGALMKKRSVSEAPRLFPRKAGHERRHHSFQKKQAQDITDEVKIANQKRYTMWGDPNTSSSDSPPQVVVPSDPNALNCTPAKLKNAGPIARAGIQQVNDTEYFCNGVSGQPCRLDWGVSQTTSQSYQVSNSTTDTNTQGSSVSVQAGWNSIEGPQASITGTISADEAHAIESSLSTSTEHSQTVTTNYDMVQAPNTFAKLTFVPFMSCQQFTTTCNDGEHTIEHCQSTDPTAGYPFLMYTG